jgi:alpha-D-ribose 1-methylphosphonate 5-triphosphate synthase subunit PhnH
MDPAVLRNLINIGTFHQLHADVGVAQAVYRATIAVAIQLNDAVDPVFLNLAGCDFRHSMSPKNGNRCSPQPDRM